MFKRNSRLQPWHSTLSANIQRMKATNTVPKSLVALAALVAIGAGAGAAGLASAQTPNDTPDTTQGPEKGERHMGMRGPHGEGRGIHGTVSAVSGNTVTVTKSDGTTYTVDASSAKVSKIVDLSVSDIKVGDTIGVQGTVSGTSVTAVHIMDGIPPRPQAPPANTQ